jgi:hypothetical protein
MLDEKRGSAAMQHVDHVQVPLGGPRFHDMQLKLARFNKTRLVPEKVSRIGETRLSGALSS